MTTIQDTAPRQQHQRKAPAPRSRRPSRKSSENRDSRTKRIGYVVGGAGAFLVFAVPLVFALIRSLQPNAVVVSAPDSGTFFDLTLENFRALANQP